jgi:hypothetical protein
MPLSSDPIMGDLAKTSREGNEQRQPGLTHAPLKGYTGGMKHSHAFDSDRAVRLLQELVRIDTTNPPGHERKGAELLAEELESFGLRPKISDLGSGRANVTAVLEGRGTTPALIYNGHIDVVPVGEARWRHPPFGGEIHGGRLYGRGSSDMKSGLAAMLTAVGTLTEQGGKLGGSLVFSGGRGIRGPGRRTDGFRRSRSRRRCCRIR